MSTEWTASSKSHSGETYEVTRAVINSQGKWELERVRKVFRSAKTAQAYADQLNTVN
jgi:hypothetical protein